MKDYTYNEYLETVFRELGKLTHEEKDSLLSNLKLHEIFAFLTTDEKEKVNGYIFELRNTILNHLRFHNALCKLLRVDFPKDKTIVESYQELSAEDKFKTALDLMNEPDFQKDCSQILVDDYKRLAKSDPFIGAIDKTLNISGYFEKLLKQGIGCNHKYEVTQ